MNELIEIFNDDKTHIEVDAFHQQENDSSKSYQYTYTIYLIGNKSNDILAETSIDLFTTAEINYIITHFKNIKDLRQEANR